MAKKKAEGGVNISAAIKAYVAENPDVGPTEAAAALTKQLGKTVSPSYVSNIKGAAGGGKGKRGKRKGGAGDAEKAVMEFVLFQQGGNLTKALKAIEDFEVPEKTPMETFIDNIGGKANAVSVIQALKEKAK